MKKLLTLALLALTSIGATAQTEVEKFVPGTTLEGVNYFLPQTALHIVVEMEKKVVTPGELNKYAFRYMRLSDVPTTASTTYTIKSVRLVPYGIPDSELAFNVKVKSKTIAPLVTLTSDGLLLSINKEVAQPTPFTLPANTTPATPVNPRDYMTQEMLAATSNAKLAELCAQEIYDIRDSRNALVRGEADNTPKDGAQLQLMLSQLDQQATALESLFKGTTATSTVYKVMDVIPDDEKEVMVMRFSKTLGVVDSDDLAGDPIYMNIKPVSGLPTRVDNESIDKKKDKMEKGIFYIVPVREAVTLRDMKQTYAQMEIPMAQFGAVEVLSEALFNKGATTKVTFFSETGGIEKLEQ